MKAFSFLAESLRSGLLGIGAGIGVLTVIVFFFPALWFSWRMAKRLCEGRRADELVDRATKEALTIAKDNGVTISFDPNYRPPLWNSEDEAREKMVFGMQNTDILKISDNEIVFLTGEENLDKGVRMLIDRYEIPLVFATLGPGGSRAYYKGERVDCPGFKNPNTIETTGAGDTFCACGLHFVLKYGLKELNIFRLRELLTFANAAASLVTTRRGALAVMPTEEEVMEYIRSYQ